MIGGGAAGLSVAAVAAQLGVRTALIERGAMGGECLNTGCVPSKALLAAAKAVHNAGAAGRFGIEATARVDFAAVHRHVRGVIEAIAPHDSVERFEGLGVEVIRAEARFVGAAPARRRQPLDPGAAGGHRHRLGAGGAADPGHRDGRVFHQRDDLRHDRLPEHLLIVGAGPIGIELAQAYRRLGAAVTVVEAARAMPRDDPELAAMLLATAWPRRGSPCTSTPRSPRSSRTVPASR